MKILILNASLVAALTATTACRSDAAAEISALTATGASHLKAGDFDRAIADLNEAIRRDSTRADAYKLRGNAYRGKGDLDHAIADYDAAIALTPRDDGLFNDRGFAHQQKAEYPKAIESFDRALALNAQHALALKNRGRSHFYLGNFEQAAADLAGGLALDTTNIHVTMWLHIVRRRLGRDDHAEFATNLARTDTVSWPAQAAKHYLGQISAAELFVAATHPDSAAHADRLCTARFHAGEHAIIAGKPQDARVLFEQVRATCRRDFSEYAAAVAELARIKP